MRTFQLLAALLLITGSLCAEEVQGLVMPIKQVSVSSPVMQDIIQEIAVKEGDVVREGQVLAQLQSEKEQLEADLYKKQIEKRAFDAKNAETLFKEKMTSKENMLEKQTDLALAKIQHQLAMARLNEKTIKSPISGTVVKKYKESGEAADRVEKLFDIVNIDSVYIQFYLDPKLMDVVTQDAKVPVRFPMLPAGSREYAATVSFIDPRIDAASGLFRVKLLLENPNHEIKAGMRAQADFGKLKVAGK